MFVLLSRFTWLLAETIFAWYTFLNGYPLPFCSSILKEKPLQGGKEMTDEKIRELIDAGVNRGEIEYIVSLKEIGQDFQDQLLQILAKEGFSAYQDALSKLYEWGVLENDPFDTEVELSPEQEAELNAALDYIKSLDAPPKEIPLQMQYLNNTLIMRNLFDFNGNILEKVIPGFLRKVNFSTTKGERWHLEFWTDSNLTVDKSLDQFDWAVMDAIYTLHCNKIKMFSTRWIDTLLSGNRGKAPTENSIARIDRTIDKLSRLYLGYEVQGELADDTPLLSVQKFGNTQGWFYYLNSINNLYAYAHDKNQVINVPNSYLDTSKLPKEFAFADTETAMVIKRRVILRVMRILYLNSKGTKRLKNWNRISLIQKKDKSDGLFPNLGLMPNIDGLDAAEAEKKLKQWRTKQKPMYIKVVRGTLENLKRQYVILDYEEHKDNDSKSLRDPVTGFDIICFNKTEQKALYAMRDEQKPGYVAGLLKKRHKEPTK